MPYVSPTPEKFSYALVAHKGNGGKIARVDGLYMSSEFAAKVKHSNNASLTVHKAQLQATQASLANIKRRHVFRLMDLPEEVRRIILIMTVRNQHDLGWFWEPARLPAIAAAGNEQLRLETILAALQNNVLDQTWGSDMTPKWLATVNFGALQTTGIPCPRDGLGAIRTVSIMHQSGRWLDSWNDNTHLLGRLDNLRHLLISCHEAIQMFEIGFDYSMSGDALSVKVREYNLDLPALNLPSLRRLTVAMRFDTVVARRIWVRNVASYVPDWRAVIEDGCKKVAGWLGEEYNAHGLRVTVDVQTELDDKW